MLNQAWIWFLYGDKRICARMMVGAFVFLLIFSEAILQPHWKGLQKIRKEVRERRADLQQAMQTIDNSPLLPEKTSRSLPDLGKDFGLAVMLENQTWYFSGGSDEILAFLLFVLRQGPELQAFHLMKTHYKMRLAVPL